MKIRMFCATAAMLLFHFASSAQPDTLFTTRGIIVGQVLELGPYQVSYTHPGETLIHTVHKALVDKIALGNGKVIIIEKPVRFNAENGEIFVNGQISTAFSSGIPKHWLSDTKFRLVGFDESRFVLNTTLGKDKVPHTLVLNFDDRR